MCKNFKSTSGQSRARLANPTHPRTPPVLGVKRTQTCRSLPGNRENRENLLKERWRGRGAATERRREKGRGGGGDRWDRGRSGDEGEGGRVSETVGDRSVSRLGEEGGDHVKPQRLLLMDFSGVAVVLVTELLPRVLIDQKFWWNGWVGRKVGKLRHDASVSLPEAHERVNSGWKRGWKERKGATLWSDEVVCVTD